MIMKTESASRAWIVILVASLFFFYEFIQQNMLNSISTQLMHAFNINATQLSEMSSYYFVSNVIFLFFAGMILDRYSAKQVILIALLICIGGVFGFSIATSYWETVVYRFLVGIGSAFCFLSVIRLATRWFHEQKLAFVTAIIVAMAMLGGSLAQTPFEMLMDAIGWRHALVVDAVFGIVIFFVILAFVKDYPPSFEKEAKTEFNEVGQMGYWKSLRSAFLKKQNWLGGIYSSLMNLPLSVLGGLWGETYLQDSYGISHLHSGNITMMIFWGTAIGGPIFGWVSDKIANRRQPMFVGVVLSFVLMAVVIFVPGISYAWLVVIFLMLGLTTSSQIIGYPVVAESSLPAIIAMSVSVVNITTMGGQFIYQRSFGALMDLHAHHIGGHKWVYTAADFHWAMLIFPVGFILAFLAALALKETYAKPRHDHYRASSS